MIMHDNTGHIVHHQEYLEELGMAITINAFDSLAEKFSDRKANEQRRKNVWNKRYRQVASSI